MDKYTYQLTTNIIDFFLIFASRINIMFCCISSQDRNQQKRQEHHDAITLYLRNATPLAIAVWKLVDSSSALRLCDLEEHQMEFNDHVASFLTGPYDRNLSRKLRVAACEIAAAGRTYERTYVYPSESVRNKLVMVTRALKWAASELSLTRSQEEAVHRALENAREVENYNTAIIEAS